MNRHYNAQTCLELINKIDEMFRLPFIGSDIIVGFPDENETDFATTYKNASESKLSAIHVFPYSIRKNTKAAEMTNQIPEKIKHQRADLLHKVANEKLNSFISQNIGIKTQILIEKNPDKKTGLLKGVTPNYLTVYLNACDKNLLNTIQNIKITTKDSSDKLFGEIY